ncbi:MAG TPA: peptidoglycan-binding domain-containing protein [Reyranella sp.]|jgi:hypothetical protein|nr:peptidoglycan-binding domain-containing protein [Reyranella sp.]
MRSYQQADLTLAAGNGSDPKLVKDLQADLRALGYLWRGIDGDYGSGTKSAVRALCDDLINNDGSSTGGDGRAPVAIRDYNKGRVTGTVEVVAQNLAACIDDLMMDPRVPKLPRSDVPQQDNARALAAVRANVSRIAPTPFLLAMVMQESNSQHFAVPGKNDEDTYVIVGLDRNDRNGNKDRITSRGYGMGQATLFHHPPRPEELQGFIADPVGNANAALAELRQKFDDNVLGKYGADDRAAEHPMLSLRPCRYQPGDARYMNDCVACAKSLPSATINTGTPWFVGSSGSYQPDGLYPSADYGELPSRVAFLCDWPYAVRRYNGSGNDSYHYQAIILRNLRNLPVAVA